MNRSELDHSDDLLNEEDQTGLSVEYAQPLPMAEQLAQQIENSRYDRRADAETIINKVIEVAEGNRTIERILERKHEVKDLASPGLPKQQFGFSGAIGQFEQQKSKFPTEQTAVHSQALPAKRNASVRDLVMGNTLYGYAIRYGFMSALLALCAAVLAVSLFT